MKLIRLTRLKQQGREAFTVNADFISQIETVSNDTSNQACVWIAGKAQLVLERRDFIEAMILRPDDVPLESAMVLRKLESMLATAELDQRTVWLGEIHQLIERFEGVKFIHATIGQFADHNPAVGDLIDECVATGKPFFADQQPCKEKEGQDYEQLRPRA